MKKILSNKLYMAGFVADMVSNFGDVLYYLALMNYVLELEETSLAVAMVTASETLPIVAMVFLGAWADKTKNKIGAIMATLGLRVALYTLLGFFMGFTPALWVVFVAVVVNLLSDLSGQYESALFIPLSLRIVPDEDREQYSAFRQAVRSLLQLLFQSSGAFFIAIMSYQKLAFFNAGTFLFSLVLMMAIRPSLQKLLDKNPIKVVEKTEASEAKGSGLVMTIKQALESVKHVPVVYLSMFVITGLNAVFVALSPLLVLSIKRDPNFILFNATTTIAALSIIAAVGTILGSILVSTVWKEISLIRLLQWSAFLPLPLFAGFYMGNVYLVFAVIFIATLFTGMMNPKFGALMMRSIPEEQLGTVGAGLDTLAQGGMVITQLVTAVLVVRLSIQTIAALFFGLGVLLLVYTLVQLHRVPKEETGGASCA